MAKSKKPTLSVESTDNDGKIIVKVDRNNIPYYVWKEIKPREKVNSLTPKGTRVWPASVAKGELYEIIRVHEPGEAGWPTGGVTLFEGYTKGYRYFTLEEVKLHPSNFKRKKTSSFITQEVPKKRKSYYKPKNTKRGKQSK